MSKPFHPPIPILMEDELVHTEEHPLCQDRDCPCWQAFYEAEDRSEQAYIERGFMHHDQLPEYRTFEPEMTVLEYARPTGQSAVVQEGQQEQEPPPHRYRHSLYFGTMPEAEAAYEVLDELLCEVVLEMETVPDVERRRGAELRFYTQGPLSGRDQATLLTLVGLSLAHAFNEQEEGELTRDRGQPGQGGTLTSGIMRP